MNNYLSALLATEDGAILRSNGHEVYLCVPRNQTRSEHRFTALLIGEFYQELARNKVTKAEALRRAQITLLKKHPNYSRPSYWAAYVLVGNWL